jgi:hypothetical protein
VAHLAVGHGERVQRAGEQVLETYAAFSWGMIHTWASTGLVLTALYEGRLEDAARRAAEDQRRGRRSFLFAIANLRLLSRYFVGCAELALAWRDGARSPHAVAARAHARALAREALPRARAMGLALEAGLAGLERGAGHDAHRLALGRAHASLEAAGLGILAAAVAHHLARSSEGEPVFPSWVRDPERLAWALAPCVPRIGLR